MQKSFSDQKYFSKQIMNVSHPWSRLGRDVSVGQVVLAVLVMLVTPGTRGSQF